MTKMIFRHRPFIHFVVLILAGLILVLPKVVVADITASKFIDQLGNKAIAAASDKSLSALDKETQFRQILRQKFALKGISKFVLGRYWRRANAQEQARYMELFESYVVYTYLRNFNNYSGQTFRVTGERDDGRKGTTVSMEILNGKAPPIKLDWRLKKSKKTKTWRIIDLKAEGVSMAVTQRTDFGSAIQGHGGKVSPFLDDLERKVAIAKSQVK